MGWSDFHKPLAMQCMCCEVKVGVAFETKLTIWVTAATMCYSRGPSFIPLRIQRDKLLRCHCLLRDFPLFQGRNELMNITATFRYKRPPRTLHRVVTQVLKTPPTRAKSWLFLRCSNLTRLARAVVQAAVRLFDSWYFQIRVSLPLLNIFIMKLLFLFVVTLSIFAGKSCRCFFL